MNDQRHSAPEGQPEKGNAQSGPSAEWAECLARAALSGAGKGNKITMVTPWVNPDGTTRPEHDPYSYGLAEALWNNIPLLVPLLRDAGAHVVAAPGTFFFFFADSPDRRYTVEAAIPYTYMLPWVGVGLFTDRAFEPGEVVGPARIAGKRTPLGRYANHSPWPNVEFRPKENGDLESIALRPILPGGEILNDYRQGAALWGATFDPHEVALTLSRRPELLSAIPTSLASGDRHTPNAEEVCRT